MTTTNEPTVLRKAYSAPYVLDRGKLSRMLTIIEQRSGEVGLEFQPDFEVTLKNGKNVVLRNAQDLFALDNSIKNPIRELAIRVPTPSGNEDRPETRVALHFDSDRHSNVGLVVVSPNTKWATELFAELEEQIDRAVANTWMTRLKSLRFEMVVAAMIALTVLLISAGGSKPRGAFSKTEAAELRSVLHSARTDTDRIAALVTVKLRELDVQTDSRISDFDWKRLLTVRSAFIALPIVLLIATLAYMLAACYPWSVFAWGDYEQHYETLVARRRTLWTVVVASVVLGIVTNMFVLSLPAIR